MTDDPRVGADPRSGSAHDPLPPDPDLDAAQPSAGSSATPSQLKVVLAVAVGGVVGALCRYQVGLAFPVTEIAFPWPTFAINVVGSLLIGVLLVLITERYAAPPLVRPLLGTGVLGGFTTFSTYALDIHRLLRLGHPLAAFGYLAATLFAAVAAAAVGILVTRRLTGLR